MLAKTLAVAVEKREREAHDDAENRSGQRCGSRRNGAQGQHSRGLGRALKHPSLRVACLNHGPDADG